MITESIPVDIMHQLLTDALSKTYSFNSGIFLNESDFKLELYHNLACLRFNGLFLSSKGPNSNTCYLHSEGKAENGKNGKKADILICNPYKFQFGRLG